MLGLGLGFQFGTLSQNAPPSQEDILQWLKGGVSNGIPTNDRIGVLSAPTENAGTLIQTDFGILSHVTFGETGTGDLVPFVGEALPYYQITSSRPEFYVADYSGLALRIYYTGTGWECTWGGFTWTNVATTTFPPKTGWTTVGLYKDITLEFDSFWIEDGEFVARTQAEIENHNENEFATRSSIYGSDIVSILTYSEVPTGAKLLQLNKFLFSECSADIYFYEDYSMNINADGELVKYEV